MNSKTLTQNNEQRNIQLLTSEEVAGTTESAKERTSKSLS